VIEARSGILGFGNGIGTGLHVAKASFTWPPCSTLAAAADGLAVLLIAASPAFSHGHGGHQGGDEHHGSGYRHFGVWYQHRGFVQRVWGAPHRRGVRHLGGRGSRTVVIDQAYPVWSSQHLGG